LANGYDRIKKVIFGGLLFIGGAIMYSIGTLGIADTDVVVTYMEAPQYLGIITMLVGLASGYWCQKRNKSPYSSA